MIERLRTVVSYCGRDSTIQKISNRFFWNNIKGDVEEFIKKCDQCQKQGENKKVSSDLHSIPINTEEMQQIVIDICSLLDCIDCFSKWSEAKPIKDKSDSTIAKYLYEIICRHGCKKVQINDQGREFVNEVSKVLHNKVVLSSA